MRKAPAAAPITAITPTESQLWWGYVSDGDIDNLPYDGNLGYGSAVTINNAIMVEGSNPFINTSTIKAIRFWLGDDISAINSNIIVWISKSLPSSASNADYKQVIAKRNISPRLNELVLTTPYDATKLKSTDKLYIGFSFSISKQAYPVMSYGQDVPGGFFYNYGNGWIDFCGEGYGYGNLALQLLLDGGRYPECCASVGDLGQSVVKAGESAYIPVTITNLGKDPINEVEVELQNADGTKTTTTLNLDQPIYMNGSDNAGIAFASATEPKKAEIALTITKVNGKANTLTATDGATGTGSLITVSEVPPFKPVVEEFTGTWCGYCPRGTVYMQKAHEQYGDEVVLIAVHDGDPMQVEAYSSVITRYCNGYPDATINRTYECDPSAILYYLPYMSKQVTQGKIDLTAEWSNENQTAVNFSTKSTFGYSDNDGQYGVALVLVEDGLSGTGSNWAQKNYYSGSSGDQNMQFWYNAGSSVSGLKYNHVAVAAWNALNGASISSSFQADVPIEYNFTGDISSNAIIQDKSQLSAVALLIDRVSGKIVNAAQCEIGAYGSAINSIQKAQNNTIVARFSLDGCQLSAPRKGLNIVKTADGRTMKVLVK